MIPKSHPRYESLVLRDKIVKAQKEGYLAESDCTWQRRSIWLPSWWKNNISR